jgi:hypothetical protein
MEGGGFIPTAGPKMEGGGFIPTAGPKMEGGGFIPPTSIVVEQHCDGGSPASIIRRARRVADGEASMQTLDQRRHVSA